MNLWARTPLGGRTRDEFDRISITGKWLFLPRLLGHDGLDPGKEPIQSLTELVKCRNLLVHYKGMEEGWRGYGDVPSFLPRLGLTHDSAKRSLECVPALVRELANILGHDPPTWLNPGDESYFVVRFERGA